MSDIKVELNGDEINRAVADAIIKSVLGDAIASSVQAHVDAMVRHSYNNPIEAVINDVIRAKIVELVNVAYKQQIEEAVEAKIAGEAAERLVNLAVEKFIKAVY